MGSVKTTTYPVIIGRSKYISALIVGRYLYLITVLFAWACYTHAIETVHLLMTSHLPIFEGLLAGFFATNTVLSLLDGQSRFQNYKRIKDQLFLRKTNALYLKTVAISRCQREAAIVAATELGMASEVKRHFHQLGYRWYHFIPDFFFRTPFFLIDPYFWKHTFFVPHYTPRFDYQKIISQSTAVPAPNRKGACKAIRVN